ncbi:universal stress protein [Mycobacterium sp. 852002-51163_SCH5372311]|uniref:universal stress protein n=1 Tax=Mycobacterium sp. 852002-51163_SCH5372311 TaxID=1834097 RepID=UPI0007FFCB16|nr:universal stress protein [Mycobacterium sp. 852002-51163_SCH5372311]OBF83729.1 universal stress protein [Mycobacterium sp. 852002-51163_SCH5372311]
MLDPTTKYGILVGVDGSAESDAAVVWAAREGVMRNVPVTLFHVVAPIIVGWPVGRLYTEMPDWQKDDAQRVIDRARKALSTSLGDSAGLQVRTEQAYSAVSPTLVEASREASMIVVGSVGMSGLGRLLLGSVSTAVLQHAHGPVAVVHSDGGVPPRTDGAVVVGIDGSAASETATALAFDEASRRGAELVALHAWSDVGVFPVLGMDWRDRERNGEEVLAERLAGRQEQYPDVQVRRELVCDTPARWLLEQCESAQLVVLGSRGRGGFPGMRLGSVSSAVAQAARIPVIVAPAKGI